MRKNKIDELFDSIEAGDCTNIELQNSQHLAQMKTLLDGHLARQRNILNEFKNEYITISNEINAIKDEMTKVVCSVIIVTSLTIIAILVWMKII